MTGIEILKILEQIEDKSKRIIVEDELIRLKNTYESYRGDYECMAIEYEANMYSIPRDKLINTVDDFIKLLRNIDNREYIIAWKGDRIVPSLEELLYVSNDGVSNGFLISDIEENERFCRITLEKHRSLI